MKVVLVAILVSFLLVAWVRSAWRIGVEYGRTQAYDTAVKSVQADMTKHCICWFTGSKCKTPSPTVICTKPEWMK